jgi:hypothetical protein
VTLLVDVIDQERPTTAASLTELASSMLFGTLSETFRPCGKPECVCHKGQRHGPYLHVSYRESGRTRGYYVPAAREQQVREGIAAWQRCSFGSQLAMAGVPLRQVQVWLGHSSIVTTQRCVHLAPGGGRELIAALESTATVRANPMQTDPRAISKT